MQSDDADDLPLKHCSFKSSYVGHPWRRPSRYPLWTRVAPEVREMAMAQTRLTGEHLHEFLTRLIREEFKRKPVPLD